MALHSSSAGLFRPRPFEFVYWAETAHSNYSRSRGRWNCHFASSIQVRGLCTLTFNYSQVLGFWVFRFWVCVPSMDRRSIASRFTLLTRRFRPFVARPVFHDDDNEQHHLPRRIASKPQTNYFLGHGFYKNYTNTTAGICSLIQARGGFVPSRNLCLGPSQSYSTSTVGDGSDKIECLADVVDVFVEKSVEVVATQAPVANEVAVAAADSYLPVAVLQYTIDGIHSIIGISWSGPLVADHVTLSLACLGLLLVVKLVFPIMPTTPQSSSRPNTSIPWSQYIPDCRSSWLSHQTLDYLDHKWAAIVLTTIIIRTATVPLLINQLKATSKLTELSVGIVNVETFVRMFLHWAHVDYQRVHRGASGLGLTGYPCNPTHFKPGWVEPKFDVGLGWVGLVQPNFRLGLGTRAEPE
ncbi:hypothetical protein ACLOJK_010201 [Asimina triloba]